MTTANVIIKVIEYLSKKGYTRTESMLRIESANQDADGRPINTKTEEAGGPQYIRAFGKRVQNTKPVLSDRMTDLKLELMYEWIEGSLDIYKVGLFHFHQGILLYLVRPI